MQDEIIKIQEVLSHQSYELSQLNDVIYAQSREIDELKRQVEKLRFEMQSMKSDDNSGIKPLAHENKPPHY